MMWMVGLISSGVALITAIFAWKSSTKANKTNRDLLLINDKFEKFERNTNKGLFGLKMNAMQIESAVYKIAMDLSMILFMVAIRQ